MGIELETFESKKAKKTNFDFSEDRTRVLGDDICQKNIFAFSRIELETFELKNAKKTNLDLCVNRTRVLGDQIYKKKYFHFFKDRTLAFSHTQPPKLKKSTYSVHVHHQMEASHTAKHKE